MRKSTPYTLTLVFFITSLFLTCSAQIGIGTTNPHSSSILDIKSDSKGFLPPRMTGFERGHINKPSEGLLIYCIDCCTSGVISVFSGQKWRNMPSCLDEDPDSDGITQINDLDEDNDGILDVVECPFGFADFNGVGTFIPGNLDKTFTTDVNPNYS